MAFTVGDLKAALKGLPDDMLVEVLISGKDVDDLPYYNFTPVEFTDVMPEENCVYLCGYDN